MANGDAQKKPWDLLNLLQFFFWVVKIKKTVSVANHKTDQGLPRTGCFQNGSKMDQDGSCLPAEARWAEGFHQPEALPP